MHTLDLILNLEAVVLSKIDVRQDCIFREISHSNMTLRVLPPGYKIMSNKFGEIRLQVLQKF
jgi:hypothetical protein